MNTTENRVLIPVTYWLRILYIYNCLHKGMDWTIEFSWFVEGKLSFRTLHAFLFIVFDECLFTLEKTQANEWIMSSYENSHLSLHSITFSEILVRWYLLSIILYREVSDWMNFRPIVPLTPVYIPLIRRTKCICLSLSFLIVVIHSGQQVLRCLVSKRTRWIFAINKMGEN